MSDDGAGYWDTAFASRDLGTVSSFEETPTQRGELLRTLPASVIDLA